MTTIIQNYINDIVLLLVLTLPVTMMTGALAFVIISESMREPQIDMTFIVM